MKTYQQLFICLILFGLTSQMQAQEFIYKTDGSVIEAEIESIESNTITYKTNKKSIKAPVVKVEQTSLIVFENGHYLTFPNPKFDLKSIRNKSKIPNDLILTKYVDVLEGRISKLGEDKIDFYNTKSNTQTSIRTDEVLMVIYSSGDHKLLKKAPEIRTFLEHMQTEVIAFAEKPTTPTPNGSNPPATGRPDRLSENLSKPPASEVIPLQTTSISSAPIQAVSQPLAPAQQIVDGESSVVSNNSLSIPTTPQKEVQLEIAAQNTAHVVGYQSEAVKEDITQETKQVQQPVQQQVQPPLQQYQTPVQQERVQGNYETSTNYPSNYQPPLNSNSPSELNNIDFDEFSDKALQKIDDFTNYLGIIASKETYPESANQAIELAIELFVSEDVQVEVSTSGFSASMKRKIRDYLNRLKLLKYDRVDIQWADINYVSNFRKAPDGNYYGTVSVKQTFRGYKDNQVVYSDVTAKDVEVVIKGMEKSIQGQKQMVWDVLLSDIGVVDTK